MFGFARRVLIARTMRQPFAARRGGSSPFQGIAHFWSRGQNSKEKEEAAREPWPVSSGTIAKQLIMKPLLTGAGYGLGTMLVTSSFITGVGTEMLPALIQFGIVFLSTNVAGGVGSSVGIISGATTCLIEGKWLVRALPISSVTKKLGSGEKLGEKAAETLALTLQDALAAPSFVPRLARPFWRFGMNQAIPLDSLLLVPDRILETIEEKPDAGLSAVCEAVLLGVVAEGLSNLKSKYRMWGLGGVVAVYGCTSSCAMWAWPVVVG